MITAARRLRRAATPVLGVLVVAGLMSACGGTGSVAQDQARVAHDKALVATLEHQLAVEDQGLPANVVVGHYSDALQRAKRQLSRDESAVQN